MLVIYNALLVLVFSSVLLLWINYVACNCSLPCWPIKKDPNMSLDVISRSHTCSNILYIGMFHTTAKFSNINYVKPALKLWWITWTESAYLDQSVRSIPRCNREWPSCIHWNQAKSPSTPHRSEGKRHWHWSSKNIKFRSRFALLFSMEWNTLRAAKWSHSQHLKQTFLAV